MSQQNPSYPIYRIALAGLFALFLGLGLCRFGYTPLIPALISNNWVSVAGAAYLGTINFAGYLLGSLLGQYSSRYVNINTVIKFSFAMGTASLFLAAIHWNFTWFAIWRFAAGVAGAFLMVLTPSVILRDIPDYYRGRISGVMFTGVGVGIIISGCLLPYIAKINLVWAWICCGLLAFVATIISWPIFNLPKITTDTSIKNEIVATDRNSERVLNLLTLVYILYGVGCVPHNLFLVDYVHTELGFNQVISGLFWTIFGIGAVIGPFLAGMAADKMGTYKSLVGAFSLSCVGVGLVIYNKITIFYMISSFLMGMTLPAIAMLSSSRILELVGNKIHPTFWGRLTMAFALSQTLAAYLMSYLLHQDVSYSACFVLAELAFILSTVMLVSEKMFFAKNTLKKPSF